VYVVMHHISLMYFGFNPQHLTGAERFITKFFSYGHLSVDWFIALSGFSLMLAIIKNDHVLKGGSLNFFKRRIIRIIPPYYATILISMLLVWLVIGEKTNTLWDDTIPITYNDVVTHLLMVHDIFSSTLTKISYSLWSISVEFRIYFVFPLLVWIWRKAGPFAGLAFSVVFVVIGSLLLADANRYFPDISLISSGVCPYVLLFAFGMFAAEISFSQSKMALSIRKSYKALSVKGIAVFLFVYVIIYFAASALFKTGGDVSETSFFIAQEVKDILVGCFAAFFLFVCASSTKADKSTYWIVRFLTWQPFVFVGTFSYSLYLIHPPLIQLLSQFVVMPLQLSKLTSTCLLLIAGTPVLISASYLFFLIFERPFLLYGKKKSIKAAEAEAVTNPAIA
jgi:peptidoglycan/LPS O-acetylase OafA/YrhL